MLHGKREWRSAVALEIARKMLAATVALILLAAIPATAASSASPSIIGYVFPAGKLIEPGEIAAAKLTRINYAFANLKGGRMVLGEAVDAPNLASLVALKRENPSLTVLISVGGWSWSGGFSDMALTRASRAVFIQSVVDFVDRYQLDGIDIDWEYPGMAGATNHFRPQDKQNYTLLLGELRERFDQSEKRLNRRLILSIAGGGDSEFLAHTEMDQVQKYVDTVNVMAYDDYEPSSDAMTGNHAPLFTDPADPKKLSASGIVQEYEKAGVPAEKIVLGVPFYSHAWGQVPDQDHGLFQKGKADPEDYATTATISASMLNHGFVRYWDSAASAPYLYNPAKHLFVSYEDAESLELKCRFIRSHKLAGIMFWNYEDDPGGQLLDVIDRQLHPVASDRSR